MVAYYCCPGSLIAFPDMDVPAMPGLTLSSSGLMKVILWLLHPDPNSRARLSDLQKDNWVNQLVDISQHSFESVLGKSYLYVCSAAVVWESVVLPQIIIITYVCHQLTWACTYCSAWTICVVTCVRAYCITRGASVLLFACVPIVVHRPSVLCNLLVLH